MKKRKKTDILIALKETFSIALNFKKSKIFYFLPLFFTILTFVYNLILIYFIQETVLKQGIELILNYLLLFSSLFLIIVYFNSCAIAYLAKSNEDFFEVLKNGIFYFPRVFIINLILVLLLTFSNSIILALAKLKIFDIGAVLISNFLLTVFIYTKLYISVFPFSLNKKSISESFSISWRITSPINFLKILFGIFLIFLPIILLLSIYQFVENAIIDAIITFFLYFSLFLTHLFLFKVYKILTKS